MRTTGRRRRDLVVLTAAAVAGGVLVAIGGLVGDAERVTQMWVGMELAPVGEPRVTEVIDYDFGSVGEKHGIFRTIPGLTPSSPVTVRSDSAPAGIAARTVEVFSSGEQGQRLKIGDPSITITGRHRYLLAYELPRSEVLDGSDQLRWDAVGTGWSVPVGVAQVHDVDPWDLQPTSCSAGTTGTYGGCVLRQIAPAHLVAGGRAGCHRQQSLELR
jgi:hypothetical protein